MISMRRQMNSTILKSLTDLRDLFPQREKLVRQNKWPHNGEHLSKLLRYS